MLTGPRQSGKTTLLRHAFARSHRFVSLEDLDVRSLALADPREFLRHHAPPLVLDEVQYAPGLLSYIKTAIDEHRKPGQWLMTGSQAFPLMQNVGQSLAGRVAVMALMPLSYQEYARVAGRAGTVGAVVSRLFRAKGATAAIAGAPRCSLGSWLLRGGYPEPRLKAGMDISKWCAGYVQTYLERDVRTLVQVGDLNAFGRFLALCAARTAQILNLSELARDAGISVPTAKKWLSVLEASYTVFLVQPYYRSIGKRLIKAPKMYFADTALVSYLCGFRSEETVLKGPMRGAIMETAVVSACYKAYANMGEKPGLFYWRTWDGEEVDLLLEWDGGLFPIEVKATATVTAEDGKTVAAWVERAGGGSGIVVADIPSAIPLRPNVTAVPWHWL
ncbi:MAG: ATP-binding protein [Candidatus Coatesbacteria bacterium]